jgi:hypothetical protein
MVAVQVRDVPEPVRLTLVAEAERRGESLQVFLLDVLEREAANARNREILRTQKPIRPRGNGALDVGEIIRQGRDAQDRKNLAASR